VTAAKLVGRDVKAVHTDITALVKAGILKQQDKGVEFPYLSIRVEFTMKPSAQGPKTEAGLRDERPIKQNRHTHPRFLQL
jgi:predicted transcriptional regulator